MNVELISVRPAYPVVVDMAEDIIYIGRTPRETDLKRRLEKEIGVCCSTSKGEERFRRLKDP